MDSVSGLFVPVEVLASDQGIAPEEVIRRIQAGQLTGRQQSNGWHVMVRVPQGQAVPTAAQSDAPNTPQVVTGRVIAELAGPVALDGRQDVVIRNVHITLAALVWLMLKIIAALVIVCVVVGLLGGGVWLALDTFGQGVLEQISGLVGAYLPS